MSANRNAAAAAIGLRAQRGGAAAVAVSLADGEPRVLLSTFLATAAEGDRLAFEPYTVASEMPRGPDGRATAEAKAAVAEGRKRQDALAAEGLGGIVQRLRNEGFEPAAVALLVNRAGWMTDLLSYSLAYPDHPPVAEGLAVREALRAAIAAHGLEAAEMDEKTLADLAAAAAGLTAVESRLKRLGAEVGPPWRKEQKAACLAAWVALATRGR